MGRDLWERSNRVKEIVRGASESVGIDLHDILFNADEETLKSTDITQIAITVVNISAAAVLEERGVRCDGAAGFSVGEYSALYSAGVVGLSDLLTVVKVRGEAMARASDALRTEAGPAGMAAVIGLDYAAVSNLCERSLRDVYIANYNSPNQIVIASTAEGLAAAEDVLKEAGARRVIPLRVSGPFHTPLIRSATEELAAALDRVDFADPKIPVYSNVTGNAISSGAEAKELCLTQIVSTVMWVHDERSILSGGYDRVLEVGPGKVLTGLWKAVGETLPCAPAGTLEAIEGIA